MQKLFLMFLSLDFCNSARNLLQTVSKDVPDKLLSCSLEHFAIISQNCDAPLALRFQQSPFQIINQGPQRHLSITNSSERKCKVVKLFFPLKEAVIENDDRAKKFRNNGCA